MKILYKPSKTAEKRALDKAAELLNTPVNDLNKAQNFIKIEKPKVIDDISEIIMLSTIKPLYGEHIVVLITNMDMLNTEGQDKLLKVLEDCEHMSVLATMSVEGRLLPTILSRMVIEENPDITDMSTVEGTATNGYNIALSKECIETLEKVTEAFDNKECLREVLHLITEKDKKNFFTVYGVEGCLCLWQLIAALIYTYIAQHMGVKMKATPSSLRADYTLDELDKSSYVAEAAIGKLKGYSYGYNVNELFKDILLLETRLNMNAKKGA